ncbi:MAG: nicotinate phosphoribosyltransferase [Candidatus Omnitrophota bacterium]
MRKSALILDFYALTMANAYQRFLPQAEATFDLFVRNLPKNRSFLVACGINDALSYLKTFAFTRDDIAYLKRFNFENDFLIFLSRIKFSGDVWAVREGTLIFPQEPILRITAPLAQGQLVEAYLLNTINVQSAIASKAARVAIVSGMRPVFDFSLRRTQGAEANLQVARASYIAGCSGTSNVLAGKLLGIKVKGTMAHSFVMAFGSELESFRAYAKIFPNQTVLLLDTYSYRQGIKNALTVAGELQEKGFRLQGVRLDSGNLLKESKKIRALLDKHGFSYVKIMASGNLDEYKIEKLVKAEAPIDSFGVGTNMGVSADAPYCEVVYKISEVNNEKISFTPTMKLSRNKSTYPGRKQVYRLKNRKGNFIKDILALEHERQKGEPLLVKMLSKGRILRRQPQLIQTRNFVKRQLSELPSAYKKLKTEKSYPVIISSQLEKLIIELSKQLKEKK